MSNRGLFVIAASVLICIAQDAVGTTVTFGFGGTLSQVSAPNGLTVGDGFTGSFSYTLEQSGTVIPLIIAGQRTRYALDGYQVSVGGQTVTSTGGLCDISNDTVPWPTSPNIIQDILSLDPGADAGGSVSGSVNGFPVLDLGFRLISVNGQPFSDTSLPTDLALNDFPGSHQMEIIFGSGGGAIIGDLASLQLVPEPGVSSLLGSAGVLLAAGLRARRALTPKPA